MSLTVERKHKYLILNQSKLNLVRKILDTKNNSENVENALNFVISEGKKNKKARKLTKHFLKSNIEIKDIFGNLEK